MRRLHLAAWLLMLALLAAIALPRLQVSGDLRMFLPDARDADEVLLLELVGSGPGARLLMLALGGLPAERLAEHSRELRERLADEPLIQAVANGDDDALAIDDGLLAYRYLLSPRLDAVLLDDADWLRDQLQARLQDLASPAAGLVEPWIPRDPTLELLAVAEAWRPASEPRHIDGVWFDRAGDHALLVIESAGGGFDPAQQQAVLAALQAAIATLDGPAPTVEISGPGAFSVLLQEHTRREATTLGLIASLSIVLLLALAYRSLRLPLLAALPLATAVLAALAAVGLLFGPVHGITLAFGFTLLGLAQDYPVHYLSHLGPRSDRFAVMRALWPTLATGALSTCIAYLGFVVAGIDGLMQLATFAIAGLAAAALSTRWLLPALAPDGLADRAASPLMHRVLAMLQRAARFRSVLAPLALIAAAVLLLSPRALWNDNLASLTPVPAERLARDGVLRAELGAPDVRHLLVIRADDAEQVLRRSEALAPTLGALRERGIVDGYTLPSDLLPSAHTQRARQARLPDPASLQAALDAALAALPFRAGVFAPFRDDVERARSLPPLTPATLGDSVLASRLEGVLRSHGDAVIGLVTLSGVHDATALRAHVEATHADAGIALLDLKAASEALSAGYRERVLLALGAALLLLALALQIALRSPARVARVLAPVLAASLIAAALLHLLGIGFTLFHLVSLVLAAGLGLDYALFFERAGDDGHAQRRTLHAVLVCAASTLLVFGLLATSSIPVLQAIGASVAIGVLTQFVCAALLARRSVATGAVTDD